MPDDYLATTQTSGTVEVGGSARGDIEFNGDRDWFAVTLEAGKTYRIDLEGKDTGEGTLTNPYLYGIHDANGNLIDGTTDNNGGAGRNSLVTFTVPSDGTYYVAAGATGTREGSYTLSVVEAPDDYAVGTATDGVVEVDSSARGEVEFSGDHDWFAVELEAGESYRIDLEGKDTGEGTLTNPYLYGIHDANGDLIDGTADNNGGAGRNSRVTFTAPSDGSYYVAVGARGANEGTYTVRVSALVNDATRSGATDLGDITDATSPDFSAALLDGRGDRVDYFKFTLSEAKKVGLGLRRQDADADLFLEDAGGNVLYSSTREGTANEWISQTLLAGTYYVRVEAQEEGINEFKLRYRVYAADPETVAALEQRQMGANEAPAFAEASYAFDLAENTDGALFGIALGSVQATDSDNGTITYSIEAGDPGDLFAIDPGTGALSYRGTGEDYASGTTSYELTVRANDGSLHSDVTVTVNVTDVAEVEEYVSLQQNTGMSEPDGEDLPADVSTTGAVAVGGSATGGIDIPYDRDWFAVTLDAGKTYRFDLEGRWTGAGTLYSPYLRGVYDERGDFISGTTDDYGGVVLNSLVFFTAGEGATYYVAAGSNADWTGTYTLSVTEIEDDFTADTGTTGRVDVDGSAVGGIDIPDDRDWFAVDLDAGKTYRFDQEGQWFGPESEFLDVPKLRGIHDAAGDLISGTTNNVDSSVPFGSRVFFTADEDATYYVAAGAGGNSTGIYTLSVTEVEDDFTADTGTTGRVDVGGSAAGGIDIPHDRDWFAVDLDAGKTYRFDLKGSHTGSGTLPDPYLRGIYDSEGDFIYDTADNDEGTNLNSRVIFTATETATYYVAAGADGNRTGTYELLVRDVTDPEDDFTAGVGTSGTVEVGGSVQGEIHYVGDSDWFEVELAADTTYQIDLKGWPTGAGTLANPLLNGVYDAEGIRFPGTRDWGDGDNARVMFTAQEGGIYYVAARGVFERTGTYTLEVEEVM